jgi:hypothetical protein
VELPDQVTLDEYEKLPAATQIYYQKNNDAGVATVDIALNNVLQRGGYTAAQKALKTQVSEMTSVLDKYKSFAPTPTDLSEKIKNWEALEASQVAGDGDFKKKLEEIKTASEKRLTDELAKKDNSFKQSLAELEEKNRLYSEKLRGIQLWEGISKLAPDLKPKYAQAFKDSFLNLFTLDETDNSLKLTGTDPESLINTPAKKMDSLRKEFHEMFLSAKDSEFSPYSKNSNAPPQSSVKSDYEEAVKNRDVIAMRSAQRRMQ